jgi:hypothetical protein
MKCCKNGAIQLIAIAHITSPVHQLHSIINPVFGVKGVESSRASIEMSPFSVSSLFFHNDVELSYLYRCKLSRFTHLTDTSTICWRYAPLVLFEADCLAFRISSALEYAQSNEIFC